MIARIIRDPARAEELAVDVFLKWQACTTKPPDEFAEAWLCRTAVRLGLDELRRASLRSRCVGLLTWVRPAAPTPEQVLDAAQEQERVRAVLCALDRRQAEILLLLRSEELSYAQAAAVIGVSASSMGTLLARAQQAFRKEYEKRYGKLG